MIDIVTMTLWVFTLSGGLLVAACGVWWLWGRPKRLGWLPAVVAFAALVFDTALTWANILEAPAHRFDWVASRGDLAELIMLLVLQALAVLWLGVLAAKEIAALRHGRDAATTAAEPSPGERPSRWFGAPAFAFGALVAAASLAGYLVYISEG